MLSTSDFEMTVVPSEGIAVFGMVSGDIFSDSGFVTHFLLSPSVIAEMGLRFGDSAERFLTDHVHLAGTHCLRVRRTDEVFDDHEDRSPAETIRALIFGLGADPSPEAAAVLERLEASPDERFHTVKFPQRIRNDKEGTDRFVFRRILVIRTANGDTATAQDDTPTPVVEE